jgi:hypothetical protein
MTIAEALTSDPSTNGAVLLTKSLSNAINDVNDYVESGNYTIQRAKTVTAATFEAAFWDAAKAVMFVDELKAEETTSLDTAMDLFYA